MSLCGTCTICTDYFDAEKSISVTQCGHLFHASCLTQWIDTCGAKKSCPQCRTQIKAKQIINKIFLNTNNHGEDEVELDPYLLKNKLDEIEIKLKSFQAEKDDLLSALRTMENAKDAMMAKAEKLKGDVKQERSTVNLLKADMEVMICEVEDAKKYKNEMQQLRIRLKTLEKIELILNGQKSDVDEMLKQYTTGSASPEMQQLGIICVSLRQEFKRIKDSRTQLNCELQKCKRNLHRKEELIINKTSQIEELEMSNANLQKNEASLTEEIQSMRKKLTALQQAIASPSDTRSSAINRLIAESPAPEFLTPVNGEPLGKVKRRPICGEPIEMKKPRLSSSSCGSDDVDLNDSADLFVEIDTKQDENTVPGKPVDSPATLKMRIHCKDMGLSFVKTKSTFKTNMTRHEKFGSQGNAATIRSKLVLKKFSENKPIGYDGLGGHKKLMLSRSKFNRQSNVVKFSSLNTSKFPSNKLSVLSPNTKFNRLKRTGPK